jgi:hypothetical protein
MIYLHPICAPHHSSVNVAGRPPHPRARRGEEARVRAVAVKAGTPIAMGTGPAGGEAPGGAVAEAQEMPDRPRRHRHPRCRRARLRGRGPALTMPSRWIAIALAARHPTGPPGRAPAAARRPIAPTVPTRNRDPGLGRGPGRIAATPTATPTATVAAATVLNRAGGGAPRRDSRATRSPPRTPPRTPPMRAAAPRRGPRFRPARRRRCSS